MTFTRIVSLPKLYSTRKIHCVVWPGKQPISFHVRDKIVAKGFQIFLRFDRLYGKGFQRELEVRLWDFRELGKDAGVKGMRLTNEELETLAERACYQCRELAKLCDLSDRQLQREFRRRLACSPQHWLDELRIIAARQLLLAGHPVKEVALQLGFKQCSHFCRVFKTRNRMTASEFVLRKISPVSTASLVMQNGNCRPRITNVGAG